MIIKLVVMISPLLYYVTQIIPFWRGPFHSPNAKKNHTTTKSFYHTVCNRKYVLSFFWHVTHLRNFLQLKPFNLLLQRKTGSKNWLPWLVGGGIHAAWTSATC